MSSDTNLGLEEISKQVRRGILDIVYKTRSPHIGSSLSVVDILVSLYFKFLNNSPESVRDEKRDRFILSKGHAALALYVVLAERGYINKEHLEGFAVNGGTLEQHPNKDLDRGIELSTGSLGHALSVGSGMAMAGKMDRIKYKVYVLLSDGELNEGSVWEAIMFAGHRKLYNLVALVDLNKIQALGYTNNIIDMNPLNEKWKAFGWHVQECNGHDHKEISFMLENLSNDKPNVIILDTVKGKGVSFMEDQLLWHYRSPNDKEYQSALRELNP